MGNNNNTNENCIDENKCFIVYMHTSPSGKGTKFSEEHKKHLGESRKKPVIQLTLSGEFIKEWNGCIDVKTELGIVHINDVCNGTRNSAGGFKWMWKDEYYGE